MARKLLYTMQVATNADGDQQTVPVYDGDPGTPGYWQKVWDETPGSAQKKLNALMGSDPGLPGLGFSQKVEWAVKEGLISPAEVQKNGSYIANVQHSQNRNFGNTLADYSLPIIAGVMGAGALAGTGTATAGAGLGQGALTSELGGAGAAELAGSAGTEALIGGAGADALTEAELAAMIESGTVGAEGAALETGALGSAAGGASAGGAAAAGGAGVAGGGALSKLSELTGIDEGTIELLGLGAGTGLGVYGADQKADALTDIANQSRADRTPFREQSLAWLDDPNAFLEGPGKSAVDSVLRRLSVKGNPTGLPSSLALAGDFALNSWLNAVTGMGNLGLSGEDTRAQLQAGAADADAQKLDAIGYGLGQATTKRRSLSDVLNSLV